MEQKIEIKAYKVSKICPKCQEGIMEYTGVSARSFPATYQHKCVNCGFTDLLENKYPKYEYEDVLAETGVDAEVDSTPAPKLGKWENLYCQLVTDGYVARDEDGKLYWYSTFPDKNQIQGRWACIEYNDFIHYPRLNFSLIRWEDEQPWAVEDLLKLEVEDD